jgi:hypothetical protein
MMKGFGYVTAVAGVSVLAAASIALASNGANEKVAGRSLIVIKERASGQQSSDKTFRGRFTLLLNGVIQDSGTTDIVPNEAATKTIDGQQQTTVFGYDNLTTKKGTLSLAFRGVSIAVNSLDPTKAAFYNESGTWQIHGASGIYKGWKGGGRWANVSTPTPNAQNIEWDGFVIR